MANTPLTGARVEPAWLDAARERVPALADASGPAVIRYALAVLIGLSDPATAAHRRTGPRPVERRAA